MEPDSTLPEQGDFSPEASVSIGPYRVQRLIGMGGMGSVYEVLQEHPRRVVALKVLSPGVANKDALRRFEFEVQTLARLRHPGIAQVYEAGTHDGGEGPQPYFTMELVAGARTLTDDVLTDEQRGVVEMLVLEGLAPDPPGGSGTQR